MALESGDGNGMVMPVAPMYGGGYGNGFGGFGGDGWWVILFLFAMMGNWGMGGFGGMGMNMFEFPWLLNGQQGINTNTNNGFDHLATQNQLSQIQNTLANGEVAECNRAMTQMQATYQNQIADMERSFNSQTAISSQLDAITAALAKCCCDNQLATESLRATVLQENCQDRYEAQANARDIIANQTAGFQRILDQMCNDKIDAKNEKILELQNALNMATLRESQTTQNALITQGFTNEVDALYNRLSACPVPTVPVYGRQPIFSCNNNSCGCGNNNVYGGF